MGRAAGSDGPGARLTLVADSGREHFDDSSGDVLIGGCMCRACLAYRQGWNDCRDEGDADERVRWLAKVERVRAWRDMNVRPDGVPPTYAQIVHTLDYALSILEEP